MSKNGQPISLSKAEARSIILRAAGLARKAPYGKGIEAAYKFIDQSGYVQIDTNYVVERAHHHALFSRVPDYKPEWLRDLQEDGRIFEYFTSDAGFMPMHDYRYSLVVKESFKTRKVHTTQQLRLMETVMDRIEREGPLTVADFDDDRPERGLGWWDWRPAKVALEQLYFEGRLMVTRTPDFRRLYDLPMNIVPKETDQTMPSPEEYARYVINRTLGVMGIAYAKELSWRARFAKAHLVKTELIRMVGEGVVRRVEVEGLPKAQLFAPPSALKAPRSLSGDAWVLTPFDTVNVFRHRLRDFFDFDYQIECFVPAPKRKYGYFSLPVLLGDRFIARMDSKADRKTRTMIIHNLHFEPVKLNEEEIQKVSDAIAAFVRFNNCSSLSIAKTNQPRTAKAIAKLVGV